VRVRVFAKKIIFLNKESSSELIAGLEIDFPKNAILKLGGWFQTAYFDQEKYIFMLMKHVLKYEMINDDFKRRYFPLNCGQVIWNTSNVQQYSLRCVSR